MKNFKIQWSETSETSETSVTPEGFDQPFSSASDREEHYLMRWQNLRSPTPSVSDWGYDISGEYNSVKFLQNS
jgi:hypothetical protein